MVLPVAKVVVFGDDNMVSQRDAQQLSGGCKLLGERNVFATWVEVAGRMIVGNNNASSSIDQRVGKYFARMRKYGVECAYGDCSLGDKSLPAIE